MTAEKQNLKWAAVFSAVLALCAAITAIRAYMPRNAATAQIVQNGEIVREVDLQTEPYEFNIESPDGGYNTVRIENGKIGIVSADCPDKICIKRGFTDNGALPIVCLPHRLTIKIKDSGRGADAVAGGI